MYTRYFMDKFITQTCLTILASISSQVYYQLTVLTILLTVGVVDWTFKHGLKNEKYTKSGQNSIDNWSQTLFGDFVDRSSIDVCMYWQDLLGYNLMYKRDLDGGTNKLYLL